MKKAKNIPISKLQRATKLIKTGAKVGVNYLKYYGDKLVTSEENAKKKLDASNASDIYNSLKNLKGSPLKLAQMLSMEKNILPQAYVEKFSLAQFSVPPLSAALVIKIFKKYFKKSPSELLDTFNPEATNAASIGQVHLATKNGKKLAVKIQYPGVSDSIQSDLAMVKPIAMRMFHIKGKDFGKYFKEVENKLLEETDYELEIKQSKEVVEACKHISNLKFPNYYEELSCKQIITMDWMDGIHLSEFTQQNTNEELANKLGQTLWNFYMYQMYVLKKVHADPHPGNFLISKEGELIALDFGCMKIIPTSFFKPYFELINVETLKNAKRFDELLYELEILRTDDSEEEAQFFKNMFHELLSLFTKPFQYETFDFSDEKFFNGLAAFGEKYMNNTKLRKMNANRGSKHFIYMNRTFFGLYSLLFDLKAKNVEIDNFR